MEGGENGGNTGEGTAGDKPENKEDAVDDEEGTCSLPAEGNVDGVQGPMSKTQERNKDDAIKPVVTSDIKHDLTMSLSEESVTDRKKDVRVKELTQNMNEIGKMNEADSTENTSESESTCAIKDKMEEKQENVQQLSSETKNESTKADQTSIAPITSHEQVKKKATSSQQGKCNINQANKKSQSSSTESVAETPSIKKQVVAEGDKKIHIANKTEHGGKQVVEKVTRKTTPGEGKSPIKQKLETSGSDKSQYNLPRKSMSQKEQPTAKSKGGGKVTPRATQEKKSEKASTSNMTIRSSSPKTDAKAKMAMKSTLRADIDNKPTKSKSMELNQIERDSSEKVNQKQLKGNISNALSSSHRVRSPGRNLLEASKQKSASTGTLTKNIDSPQKQQEAQNVSTQEKSIKSKQGHEIKGAVGKSPTKKTFVERGITKGIQSSADSVAEKIVHSSFQGTISRAAKCDEKLQRAGTTEAKKSQDRMNKVTAEISATTEAAIKEQFKQLESKLPQERSVNSTHTVPKQKPKSPTRKQQKPATQQKLNEQKQILRQQSPQKQKPPRPPTRKQQELKELQQKQQTMKQQTPQKQQQTLKELSQPKQQTPQTQATNLSKQEKQQIEIKQSPQQQEKIPTSPNDQKENKTQQHPSLSMEKHNPNSMQGNEQDNIDGSHQKLKELQKQENKNEEQKLLYLKEMKDQEQKEECDQPTQQQDKQRIEQQNQQQKQWELKATHMKPHQENESGKEKQVNKEEQSEQEESKEHPKQQQQQQSEDGDDDNGRGCGMQGRSCPIYFGVKSYLHHFYDTTPVKNSHLYEEYIEEDDFEYAVDPIKNRGCRRCCRGFWFRAGLWGGINLILVGVITLLVGYLTPQREMVVGHHNNLEILDRSAIAFNRRLELCRLAGLAVFCCGGLVLLLTLLLSTFLHVGSHNNNNTPCCGDNAYYGYVATSLVEPFIAAPNQTMPISTGIKIPITEQIKSVQPTLWPDIATVKDGTLVPHMP